MSRMCLRPLLSSYSKRSDYRLAHVPNMWTYGYNKNRKVLYTQKNLLVKHKEKSKLY